MFKHADDGERHLIDKNRFTDRNNLVANFFRSAPELITSRRANHANVASSLFIEFVEHSPMSDHVIAHGRMFNELDEETARNVCVIGTATRDELWGAPEKIGHEIIPIGETVFINQVPFTVIGMFEHYESEQERHAREAEKARAETSKQRVVRNRGYGGKRQNNFVFELKNSTVLMPLNTMWIKFRSGATNFGSATFAPGDRRLSTLE